MGMIEINKEPSRRQLAWFGLLFAAFFGLVGVLALWKFGASKTASVIWAAAGVVFVLYYLIPPLRKPLYLGWLYAVLPIGWVISHLLLAAVYYLLVTPIGLGMRLCRYDPLHRRFDREASSYWIPRKSVDEKARYFRQY